MIMKITMVNNQQGKKKNIMAKSNVFLREGEGEANHKITVFTIKKKDRIRK